MHTSSLCTLSASAYVGLKVSCPSLRGMKSKMERKFLPWRVSLDADEAVEHDAIPIGEGFPLLLAADVPMCVWGGETRRLSFMKSKDSSPITTCFGDVRAPSATPL